VRFRHQRGVHVKNRTIIPAPERSSAAGVHWDLSRLFVDVAAARVALADAVARAAALEARTADVDRLDPTGLRDLLDEASALAELRDMLNEEWGYGPLRLAADVSDAEARDLVAESEEARVDVCPVPRGERRAEEPAVLAWPALGVHCQCVEVLLARRSSGRFAVGVRRRRGTRRC
jgi:hypothetical protein